MLDPDHTIGSDITDLIREHTDHIRLMANTISKVGDLSEIKQVMQQLERVDTALTAILQRVEDRLLSRSRISCVPTHLMPGLPTPLGKRLARRYETSRDVQKDLPYLRIMGGVGRKSLDQIRASLRQLTEE